MKQNRRKNLVSGVAFTCGAILLSSLSAPVVNAATADSTPAAQTAASVNAENPSDSASNSSSTTDGNASGTTPVVAPAATTPAATDTTPTTAEQNGVAQEVVAGEDPYLNVNSLTPQQLHDVNLDSDQSLADQDAHLDWTKKPDTSKPGESTGEAVLTYQTHPEPGQGQPETKKLAVKIKVDVKSGQKKADDQVRNRITYIDLDNNKVVASYSWVGQKATDPANPNYDDSLLNNNSMGTELDQTVKGLGYIIVDKQSLVKPADGSDPVIYVDSPTDTTGLATFTDKDKIINKYVKLISPDKPVTWGQVADPTSPDYSEIASNSTPVFMDSSYNNPDFDNDPANLIFNAAVLPAGTKVTWGIAPRYDADHKVINNPEIVISKPDKTQISLPLTQRDKDRLGSNRIEGYVVPTWKNKTYTVGDQPGNPVDQMDQDAIVKEILRDNDPDQHVSDQDLAALKGYLFNPQNWSWDIAPDTSNAGYSVAFAKFNPSSDAFDKLNPTVQDLVNMANGIISLSGLVGSRFTVMPKAEVQPQPQPDPKTPDKPQPQPNPNPQPQPNPDPKTPDTPNNPDTPDAPNTPETPQTPAETPDTPEAPQQNAEPKTQQTKRTPAPAQVKTTAQKSTPVVQNAAQKQAALPQTGAKQSLASLVLAVLTFGLSLVFFKKDKRTN